MRGACGCNPDKDCGCFPGEYLTENPVPNSEFVEVEMLRELLKTALDLTYGCELHPDISAVQYFEWEAKVRAVLNSKQEKF